MTFVTKPANQGNTGAVVTRTEMDNRLAKLRVALVGTGYIASIHLDALQRCKGVQVVALCDPVVDRALELAKRHGIGRVHESVEELLEVGGVDAAHVLAPPGVHAEVAAFSARGYSVGSVSQMNAKVL